MNDITANTHLRVPAEWEDYHCVLIAWPHKDSDWADTLQSITDCYIRIAEAIVHEANLSLLILAPDISIPRSQLKHISSKNIFYLQIPTNDTWTRDYGPIMIENNGKLGIADFQFNGWGLKFASNFDNLTTLKMVSEKVLCRNYTPHLDFVFEGGSMETDGKGTMLTTSQCLLSLNRNGITTKEYLKNYFQQTLGMTNVLFLDHGHLEGDDTDSHIDTLARLAPNDTILYVKSYNPKDSHTNDLNAMEKELLQLRTPSGQPYNLIALPLPNPIYDNEGNRLPATYANFLITPSAVLLPTYNQPENDLLAEQMLQIAFPDRRIIGIDSLPLIVQHGSLHCATMQLSRHILNFF